MRATAIKTTIKMTNKDITINRATASTTGITMTTDTIKATKAMKATKAIKTDTTMPASKATKTNTTMTNTTIKAATAAKVKVKDAGMDDAAAAEAMTLKKSPKHSPTSQ